MSWHREQYAAAENKVLEFFRNHPVFTYLLVGFLVGGIVTRLIRG